MKISKRIYYHDTDCGGVVYYANYLKYLEEARTEYFLDRGIDLKKLVDQGIYFVVKQVNIDYKAPARYQDIIEIIAKPGNIKTSSIEFLQEINKDDTLLIEASVILVCVDRNFRPIRIPDRIKKEILHGT